MLLQAPYLQLDFSNHQLRGVADGIALRLLHSDRDAHQARLPEPVVEKIIFEVLEQLRCESLVPAPLQGVQANIQQRFLHWAKAAGASPLVENSIGILLYTITLVSWSRLHAQAIPEALEELIEGTRWGFTEPIKQHLYALKKHRHDQTAFAQCALALAQQVHSLILDSQPNDAQNVPTRVRALAKSHRMQWWQDDDATLVLQGSPHHSNALETINATTNYVIYNNAYDKVVNAAEIIRPALLSKLRNQLDKRIRQQSVNTHRLARYLQQLIASPALAGWEFSQQQGYLDAARLTKLITSPDNRRLFKREHLSAASDCVVSILVDNSGSMNHHNDVVAALVDTLSKALELAQIRTEVLGFTTTEWNGGKVLKEWLKAGKPANPGRLTSTCHTVYKSAETPWRRARTALAGMLKTDLFRESIDGEALLWAASRIEHRAEKNKIILMICDGSPMDSATHAANSERFLDQHLSYVAQQLEQRPDLRLCALGVGLDLSAYYRQSMSINLQDELGTRDFFAIADLLHSAV